MIAGNPHSVLNLYEWLPSYGETKVSFRAEGSELTVDIFHDSKSDKSIAVKRTLSFTGVCCFFVTVIPGVAFTQFEYERADNSGALIEFENSEAARKWQKQLPWRETPIRHFQLFFASLNQQVEVFAENFHLTDS